MVVIVIASTGMSTTHIKFTHFLGVGKSFCLSPGAKKRHAIDGHSNRSGSWCGCFGRFARSEGEGKRVVVRPRILLVGCGNPHHHNRRRARQPSGAKRCESTGTAEVGHLLRKVFFITKVRIDGA